jgi:hypothetical protein
VHGAGIEQRIADTAPAAPEAITLTYTPADRTPVRWVAAEYIDNEAILLPWRRRFCVALVNKAI